MKKKYLLNETEVPTIPVVHDCVIKKVELDNDFLVFYFDNDISDYESVERIMPNSKGLIIRYHLIDELETYVWRLKVSMTKGEGYLAVKNESLLKMTQEKLEYLYHNVGYQSLIIILWNKGRVVLNLTADYVEYEWLI